MKAENLVQHDNKGFYSYSQQKGTKWKKGKGNHNPILSFNFFKLPNNSLF